MILHVNNINFQSTKDELTLLFSQFGLVEKVDIPRDRRTKLPIGYAFVRFAIQNEAEDALTFLNNTTFGGRILELSISRKNKNN